MPPMISSIQRKGPICICASSLVPMQGAACNACSPSASPRLQWITVILGGPVAERLFTDLQFDKTMRSLESEMNLQLSSGLGKVYDGIGVEPESLLSLVSCGSHA